MKKRRRSPANPPPASAPHPSGVDEARCNRQSLVPQWSRCRRVYRDRQPKRCRPAPSPHERPAALSDHARCIAGSRPAPFSACEANRAPIYSPEQGTVAYATPGMADFIARQSRPQLNSSHEAPKAVTRSISWDRFPARGQLKSRESCSIGWSPCPKRAIASRFRSSSP